MLYRRQDILKIIKTLNPKEADETIRKKWKAWKREAIPFVQFENMAIYDDTGARGFIEYNNQHSRIKRKYEPIVLNRLLHAFCGIEQGDIRSQSDVDIRRQSETKKEKSV